MAGPITCDTCNEGYTISSDNTLCIPNVTYCDIMADSTTCQICNDGYNISYDKITCDPKV